MPAAELSAAACFGIGGLAAVAICLIGYGIYRYNKPYKHGSSGKSGNGPTKLKTVDDLVSENPNLRHRNVSTEERSNASQTVCNQEIQTQSDSTKNPASTQTDSDQKLFSDLEVQTTESLLRGRNNLQDEMVQTTYSLNGRNNLDENSVLSDLSITSSTNYPVWSEMPVEEKENLKCKGCKIKQVSTITYPCKHPYMCKECAPVLFMMYNHRCPICRGRIKNFDDV